MANRKQPERWESTMLAGFMAIVGTMFLFEKLAPLFRMGAFSFSAVLHTAPMLVVAFAVSLIVVDRSVGEAGPHE
jgi:drug/metabolite transporter (DMT)-like permease